MRSVRTAAHFFLAAAAISTFSSTCITFAEELFDPSFASSHTAHASPKQPQLSQRDLDALAAYEGVAASDKQDFIPDQDIAKEEDDSYDDEDYDSSEDGSDWIFRINDDGSEDEIEVGVQQVLSRRHRQLQDEFTAKMDEIDEYLWSIYDDPELKPVLKRCKDKHRECLQQALRGDCENDRHFMREHCGPSCKSCEMLIYERRCPYDENAPKAWEPGDLNKMFQRIMTDEKYKQHEPKVWSQPKPNEEVESEESLHSLAGAPWVISLENFISDKEVERLLQLAQDSGYERSDDGEEYLEDGTFVTYFIEGRTSWNTWCDECLHDPYGQAVLSRIEDVTKIHQDHFANLQMLRYEKTQHYHVHHDFDYYNVPRQPGPRILTFFLYLSDVEEGGGTNFPHLNLTFTPKRGRALIWPNVLDEDPFEWDPRTEHQALPVVKGTKYAANAWIHQHDWQGPARNGCVE